MRTTGRARTEQALSLMLDDLEEANRWLAELDAERKSAGRARADLVASAQATMRTLDPQARRRMLARYTAAVRPPQTRPRILRGALGDVLAFLAAHETETVRACELTWHIRKLGRPVAHTYGGATLGKLEATGHVARIGHGIYRINRTHPELATVAIAGSLS